MIFSKASVPKELPSNALCHSQWVDLLYNRQEISISEALPQNRDQQQKMVPVKARLRSARFGESKNRRREGAKRSSRDHFHSTPRSTARRCSNYHRPRLQSPSKRGRAVRARSRTARLLHAHSSAQQPAAKVTVPQRGSGQPPCASPLVQGTESQAGSHCASQANVTRSAG